MEDNRGTAGLADEVGPHMARADLQRTWIGLGAALDWIVMRGQSMDVSHYRKREDEAYKVLVSILADMSTEIAEAVVRGVKESAPGPLGPIPAGIWCQTATSDSDDTGKLYRLIGTDEHDEWDGAILSPHLDGYRKIQIQTRFLLDCWPENVADIRPTAAKAVVAQARLERLVSKIVSETPEDLAPLSQREIWKLVKLCMPSAPRKPVRDIARVLIPGARPGPRGRRNPDRPARIEELGRNLIAAQLRN